VLIKIIVEEKETLQWNSGSLWVIGGRQVVRGIRQGLSALLALERIIIVC